MKYKLILILTGWITLVGFLILKLNFISEINLVLSWWIYILKCMYIYYIYIDSIWQDFGKGLYIYDYNEIA